MRGQGEQLLQLNGFEPQGAELAAEVLHGLRLARKQLPCKLLYDDEGSRLFDGICELEEYYLTRTELAIMQSCMGELASIVGKGCRLVEYGSGSSVKTQLLLNALEEPAAYVPIDISRGHLLSAARRLRSDYPELEVLPICADYMMEFPLPTCTRQPARTVAYFPGSTIGNFERHEAKTFLEGVRERCGRGGGLIIGADLKKDPAILHAAYNDSAGVTAAFNLNLLARINREAGGDFVLDRFAHYAIYNPRLGRIEMHLVSLEEQSVRVAGERIDFERGESIFTESSYKYTIAEFRQLAEESGYRQERVWMDDRQWFSVHYLLAR